MVKAQKEEWKNDGHKREKYLDAKKIMEKMKIGECLAITLDEPDRGFPICMFHTFGYMNRGRFSFKVKSTGDFKVWLVRRNEWNNLDDHIIKMRKISDEKDALRNGG